VIKVSVEEEGWAIFLYLAGLIKPKVRFMDERYGLVEAR
jgi:hypothetical protein